MLTLSSPYQRGHKDRIKDESNSRSRENVLNVDLETAGGGAGGQDVG